MCKNTVVWLNGWGHLAQDHSKWLAIWLAIASISVSGNLAIAQPDDGTDMRGKKTGERARQEADLPSVEEVVNLPTIEVIGTEERLKEIPGSGFIIPQETLYKSHVFTTTEALRKVPGVNVRDEEGFGIRPNIVGSVAGGDLPLAQGEALYQGTELFGRLDMGELLSSPHNFYAQIAWTWLGDADQESPFVCPLINGAVSTTPSSTWQPPTG